MTVYVARTCTEVAQNRRDNPAEGPQPKPLREFGDSPAIVLLGAPGAGKTEMFRREAEAQTEAFERQAEAQAGCYVTARDFVVFDDRPEWRGKTLFIDGLDEMRAGASDQRTPFDRIRAKLDKLGRPSFRLSCREADWFGATDRAHLQSVSSNGEVLVLRLDPLPNEGIREILKNCQDVEDVEDFISTAQHRGIDRLLENPQTLTMLATAVAGGSWPKTRKETFDLACLKLLSEHNPEYQSALPPRHSDADLLCAASRICALILLSGHTGCTAIADQADTNFLSLSEIPYPSQEILNRTIHTKLFNVENGFAAPTHRHIAEFLAGKYLAGLIENGLPASRILALITGEDDVTGEDDGVVSELRGLSAWLAAHSKKGRRELIERDPEGIVLYGDIKQFSAYEKRLILNCLEREAERDPWSIANNQKLETRWGDLATPDMSESFAELLTKEPTNDAWQSIAIAVLTALQHGNAIPSLRPILMSVVRDQARSLWVRELALEAYTKQVGGHNQAKHELQDLLEAVHSGAVSDPNDQLLGNLLLHLYPNNLPPSNIGRYFRVPKRGDFLGWYRFFWIDTFTKRTVGQKLIAEALDSFVSFCSDQSWTSRVTSLPSKMRNLPTLLLATYLKNLDSTNELDEQRLFGWLGASFNIGGNQGSGEEVQEVRNWFGSHPSQYKAIFAMGTESSMLPWTLEGYLFQADPPPDFGYWCLDQAFSAEDQEPARRFLEKALDCLYRQDNSEGLSKEVLERRIAGRPVLLKHYEERENYQRQFIDRQEQKKDADERQGNRENWRNAIKSLEPDFRRNSAPPSLLQQLAMVYVYRVWMDIEGSNGHDRLISLLGGDKQLVDLILNAFGESTKRTDLPKAPDIFRLASQNRQHHLALPFIAGLNELSDNLKVGKPPLDEEGMRRGLAICFSTGLHNVAHGTWYNLIADKRPDLVAKALVHAFQLSTRKGDDRCAALNQMRRGPNYVEIARMAALPLASIFPARSTLKQLGMLKRILLAAIQHCEKSEFLKIVERKLSLKSLTAGQRIYWIAAGMLASPPSFTDRLVGAFSGRGGEQRGREQRVRHLAEFVASRRDGAATRAIAELDLAAKEVLIRLIGSSYRPDAWRSETYGVWNEKFDAAQVVGELIGQVSSISSREASDALERLLKNALLKPWHSHIRHAAHRQRTARREACFTHVRLTPVLRTLDNNRPANSADLEALVTDHLAKLAKQVRHGETSGWRQYWNTDSAKRPREPKHEELCRDALLFGLQPRLEPLGVYAQPEGQYANDGRADIKVCFERLNVPVEVKKNSHRDLWTAIHSQLIAKYTRDPGANGHGIYLAFWFGPEWTKATPSEGRRPNTAKELEKSLYDTLSNAAEAEKISVVVIDVSKPAA